VDSNNINEYSHSLKANLKFMIIALFRNLYIKSIGLNIRLVERNYETVLTINKCLHSTDIFSN